MDRCADTITYVGVHCMKCSFTVPKENLCSFLCNLKLLLWPYVSMFSLRIHNWVRRVCPMLIYCFQSVCSLERDHHNTVPLCTIVINLISLLFSPPLQLTCISVCMLLCPAEHMHMIGATFGCGWICILGLYGVCVGEYVCLSILNKCVQICAICAQAYCACLYMSVACEQAHASIFAWCACANASPLHACLCVCSSVGMTIIIITWSQVNVPWK